MKTTPDYNPVQLHSPSFLHETMPFSPPRNAIGPQTPTKLPPPPPTPSGTPQYEPKTEYEKVQRKISSLYEVKTPKPSSKKEPLDQSSDAALNSASKGIPSARSRANSTRSDTDVDDEPQRKSSTIALQRLSTLAIDNIAGTTPLDPDSASESASNPSTSNAQVHRSSSTKSFEHALVIGLPDDMIQQAVEASDYGVYDPQILSSFPPDKPLALEALADFVFPAGLELKKVLSRKKTALAIPGVHNAKEVCLLFDTTATDFDNSDTDSLSSDDEEEWAPRIKTSTLYGISLTFTYTKTILVKSTSSWTRSSELIAVQVEVPRTILILSRNAYLPLHFSVLRHCAAVWGSCDQDKFDFPAASREVSNFASFPPPDPPNASAGRSGRDSPTKARGFSSFFSSQSGKLADDPFANPSAPPSTPTPGAEPSGNPFDFANTPDFQTEEEKSFFAFLTRYQNLAMPQSSTQTIRFQLDPAKDANDPLNTVKFRRIRSIDSMSILSPDGNPHTTQSVADSSVDMILEWALPTLLKHLSLDNLLILLGCALTEMQVVFCCSDVSTLSCCVTACVSLLRPLKWACPIIVTLPTSLHIYLESPVPVVLGVTSLPPDHEPPTGQLVVDIMKNKICMNKEEYAQYHTLLLPKMSTLHHDLNPHAERLENEIGSFLSDQSSQRSPGAKNFITNASRPLSPAYESGEVASAVLLSMKRFVNLTRNHTEMLIKTAVELEEEREQQAEEEKKLGGAEGGVQGITPTKRSSISKFNERKWWEQRLGGEAGIAFMDRMMETQMYNSYVFDMKCKLRREQRKRLCSYNTFNDGDEGDRSSVGSVTDYSNQPLVSRQRGIGRRRATATFSDNFHSRNSATEDIIGNAMKLDAEAAVKMAQSSKSSTFDRRYSAKALKRRSVAMGIGLGFGGAERAGRGGGDKKPIEVRNELDKKKILVDLMELMISGNISEEKAKNKKGEAAAEEKEEAEETKSSEEEKKVDVDKDGKEKAQFLWCNGMCEGAVDTEFCTMLCVKMWQDKFIKTQIQSPFVRKGKKSKKKKKKGTTTRGEIEPKTSSSSGRITKKGPFDYPFPLGVSPTNNSLTKRPPPIVVEKGSAGVDRVHISPSSVRTPPSMAANTVHIMLTKRIQAKKRIQAGKIIAVFMKDRCGTFLHEKRFQESVLKVQALSRSMRARREFAEKRKVQAMEEVGSVLKKRLESGVKAEKDIDWLFEESEAEHTEKALMMEKQLEQILTRGRAVSTPKADFNWLFRESESDMKVKTILESEAFEEEVKKARVDGEVKKMEDEKAEQDVEWLFRASETDEFVLNEQGVASDFFGFDGEAEQGGKEESLRIKPLDFNKEGVIEGEAEVEEEKEEEDENTDEEVEREEAERKAMERWERGQRVRDDDEDGEDEREEDGNGDDNDNIYDNDEVDDEEMKEDQEEAVKEELKEDEDGANVEEQEDWHVKEEHDKNDDKGVPDQTREEDFSPDEEALPSQKPPSLPPSLNSSDESSTNFTGPAGLSVVREESKEDTVSMGGNSLIPERISSGGFSSLEAIEEGELKDENESAAVQRQSTFSVDEKFPAFDYMEKAPQAPADSESGFAKFDTKVDSFDVFSDDGADAFFTSDPTEGKKEDESDGADVRGDNSSFEIANFPNPTAEGSFEDAAFDSSFAETPAFREEETDSAFEADAAFDADTAFEMGPAFEKETTNEIETAFMTDPAFDATFDNAFDDEPLFDQAPSDQAKNVAEATTAEGADPMTWKCSACTFDNNALLPSCEMCGGPRPTQDEWEEEDFERPDFGTEKFQARRASKHESFEWDDSGVDQQFTREQFGEEGEVNFDPPTPKNNSGRAEVESQPCTPVSEEISTAAAQSYSKRSSPSITEEETIANVSNDATFLNLFRARLKRGFIVRKHGRKGLPQWRVVFTNEYSSHLFWRDCTQDELDSAGGEDDGRDSEWDAESSSDERGSARKKASKRRR